MDNNQIADVLRMLSTGLSELAEVIKSTPKQSEEVVYKQQRAGALDVKEAAEVLYGSISASKLYQLAQKDRVPAIKLDGRWIFPIKQTEKWYEQQLEKTKLSLIKNKKAARKLLQAT